MQEEPTKAPEAVKGFSFDEYVAKRAPGGAGFTQQDLLRLVATVDGLAQQMAQLAKEAAKSERLAQEYKHTLMAVVVQGGGEVRLSRLAVLKLGKMPRAKLEMLEMPTDIVLSVRQSNIIHMG